MRVGALLPGVAAAGVLALQGCGGDDPARTVTVTTPGAATTPATTTRTTASGPATTTGRSRPRRPRTTTTAPSTPTVAETTTAAAPTTTPVTTTDRPTGGGARGTAAPGPGTFDPVGGTTAASGRADGTGYSVRVPPGWNDGARRFEGSSVDFDRSYVKGRGSAVTSSILVVRSTPAGARRRGIAGLAETVRREAASGAGGADVAQADARRVDGEEAVAFVVRRSLGDTDIVQRQVAVVRDGALYVAGLTAARRTYEDDARVFARFLDSWRWTDDD